MPNKTSRRTFLPFSTMAGVASALQGDELFAKVLSFNAPAAFENKKALSFYSRRISLRMLTVNETRIPIISWGTVMPLLRQVG